MLLALLCVISGVWGFAELADEIVDNDSRPFDEKVLLMFRVAGDNTLPVGPHWLPEATRDITALGGGTIITLVTIAVLGFFWLRGKHALMWLVLASVVGGGFISTTLKNLFDRERPSVVEHLTTVTSPSFPSGHSMLAAVTYLTLGALLARTTRNPYEKAYYLVGAVALSVLIGISRIYLGVHYPTDVLAGWCAGLVWASLCVMAARWLQRKGAVESADETSAAQPGS
ncbi:phosphatase PAP2 family protein [Phragmitibacter flavus]|uniref:Phosphatase PAP2 family protein n=1 Tax=Phragmitibacter flavus TaxID=2576071 RepID=A0A5R8KHP3_9BACT|nr:phosphatase PAP2 family protein [Phragmitibacter flavus]